MLIVIFGYNIETNTETMTPEELKQKVEKAIKSGSKLSYEQIEAIFLKGAKNKIRNDKRKAKRYNEKQSLKNEPCTPLWGRGTAHGTQAEYQRSLLGSKWN